jgi:hypothetical protein
MSKTKYFPKSNKIWKSKYFTSNSNSSPHVTTCHYYGKKWDQLSKCRKHKSDMLNWIPKPQISLISTDEDQLYLFDFSLSMKFASKIFGKLFFVFKASQHMSPLHNLFENYMNLATLKTIYMGDNSCTKRL